MAPPYVLYIYAPTLNVIKSFGTPNAPIVIMPTNVAFSPEIPKKYENKVFEDFMAYLTTSPRCYALVDVVDPFLPQHVCYFYYTSTCDDVGVIIGTTGDGKYTISLTATNI
ncbi:unnamed protein product [Lactuca virosa]|uniref:Uncharacterized protein n=1 Tax=Lactuca virosa TaxID=75947 RepID=A0AAU9PDU3_9ASTR|nr:unnamed protein product [Lactuca virosa]